jgi:predicted flap endonuclease-1-like 5' DNA nuclease
MPYTLSMALLWVALAVLLGIVVGWLMRSVVAKRQIERARSNHLDTVELERLRGRVSELELGVAERDRLRVELDACRSAGTITAEVTTPEAAESPTASTVEIDVLDDGGGTDLAPALAVPPFELDDLTVVEGIGPKIADLCHGIGIQTWRDLAQTEVSLLRTMLHDAGPRFRSHDPSTWPEQAALLADGRWTDFRAFTAKLDGGRRDSGPEQ